MRCAAVEDAAKFVQDDLHVVSTKRELHFFYIYHYADGNAHLLHYIKSPFFNNSGNIIGVCCQAHELDTRVISKIDHAILRLGQRSDDHYSFSIDTHYKFSNLTDKESAVLFYLLRGRSAKMIALKFARSKHIVETHIANITAKLRCQTVDQFIQKVFDDGCENLIPPHVFSDLIAKHT